MDKTFVVHGYGKHKTNCSNCPANMMSECNEHDCVFNCIKSLRKQVEELKEQIDIANSKEFRDGVMAERANKKGVSNENKEI